jgi:glucose/arabinose dehydrogenase
MKAFYTFILFLLLNNFLNAQTFIRSELPTQLSIPWEITYGQDGYLWVSDSGGRVSRIDPSNGNRIVAYTAPDYFPGSALEQLQLCFTPQIGAGTLGLALHPDFIDSSTSFIYFIYSYNNGTVGAPETRFKLKRLKWNASSTSVVNDTDLVTGISTGYDHLGGRLIAIRRNLTDYLFLTVGDHGISETNSPTCYNPQSDNPNNFAQDPTTDNGKIHRFNIDGSIPVDNPISGNSFYTRGHRNPQGLMYNPNLDILYGVEHGDRSDDEINILHPGMNYGWKYVRGFHSDNNFPGEATFISNYVPDPNIANDSLVEAFYSWCATTPDTSTDSFVWCTVAPSDGIYYGNTGIPEWTNSLLVVSLKNGVTTDQELFQFKLLPNGELKPSTTGDPNPKKFFGDDQVLNGRLRDVTFSPDGMKIYLINNFGTGTPTNKITVYTYDTSSIGIEDIRNKEAIQLFPNPAFESIQIISEEMVSQVSVYNVLGDLLLKYSDDNITTLKVASLSRGIYFVKLKTYSGKVVTKQFVKE